MTLFWLFLAALLEAGGDALVRSGLRSPGLVRIALLFAGAVVLFAYGCMVNASHWDFGRLLGVYVAFFFIVAQLINWIAFHKVPSSGVLWGGVCIVAGGVIVALSPA